MKKKRRSKLADKWGSRPIIAGEVRMCVFGSRSLNGKAVRAIIKDEISKHGATRIVTAAEPKGVCEEARKVCGEVKIPLVVHFKNPRFLAGMFAKRSEACLLDSDIAIFIHDGESKGTAGELAMAKKMEMPFKYHRLDIGVVGVAFDSFDVDDFNLPRIDGGVK